MKHLVAILLLVAVVYSSGCASLGLRSERVLQKKVEQPVYDVITEDVKQASDYIAHESTESEVKGVAIDLSQRVGAPETPLEDPAAVSDALAKGGGQYQSDLAKLNRHLERYGGRDIEGTGISIWGAGIGFLLIGAIVICVFLPAAVPLVFYLIRLVSGTSRRVLSETVKSVTTGIDEWGKQNPEAFRELKDSLSKRTDNAHKSVIQKARVGNL